MGKLVSFHPSIPECDPPNTHSFVNTSVRCQCGAETWPETLDKTALTQAGYTNVTISKNQT